MEHIPQAKGQQSSRIQNSFHSSASVFFRDTKAIFCLLGKFPNPHRTLPAASDCASVLDALPAAPARKRRDCCHDFLESLIKIRWLWRCLSDKFILTFGMLRFQIPIIYSCFNVDHLKRLLLLKEEHGSG